MRRLVQRAAELSVDAAEKHVDGYSEHVHGAIGVMDEEKVNIDAIHALVAHLDATRGPGVVVELMVDGRTRILFDSGTEHRYKPAPNPSPTPHQVAPPLTR